MSDTSPSATRSVVRKRPVRWGRTAVSAALWIFVLGNLVGILWIWKNGGGDGLGYHWHTFDDFLVGMGRLTAFLSGYFALIEVVLLARLPFLERMVGFDRLTVWHRWGGHAVLDLAIAHVIFTVWGYAKQDGNNFFSEYWDWLTLPQPKAPGAVTFTPGQPLNLTINSSATSPYPGIITATVGTALLVAVLVTSLVVVKKRLSYEWWYAVHFTAYAGIALAWFHMIPDGNDLVIDHVAASYWKSLYILSLGLVIWFRLLIPIVNIWRLQLRVTEVVHEGPGVISLRVEGRGLARLGTKPGQFFFWRFLTKGFWYTQHPFSISEAPHGNTLRITVKNLGDHTAKFDQIKVGTRTIIEGPFGVFTDEGRNGNKALLIAGGIGITPIRAMLEEMDGDVIALYRVVSNDDIVFSDELDKISRERGSKVSYVVGDHTTDEGRDLLSARHLQELVPDIAERHVYLCGPTAMVDAIVANLERANVSRDHLHVERFAL
ncbi:MAG: ferric reductase-like transmembrane domain-containing protein [Actinomycetes bacterium]